MRFKRKAKQNVVKIGSLVEITVGHFKGCYGIIKYMSSHEAHPGPRRLQYGVLLLPTKNHSIENIDTARIYDRWHYKVLSEKE